MESSPLLSDRDLVSIIESDPALSRLLAISRRKKVSDVVSTALIDKEESTVISSLLGNSGADISEAGYGRIVNDHKDDENIMLAVAERPHLPAQVMERLISSVSDSLAARLKDKYDLDNNEETAQEIDMQVAKTREQATLRVLQGLPPNEEIRSMVANMHATGKLTHSLVLSALCHGHTHFFAASMAKLAGIPLSNTVKLIDDRGQLGFPALYKKSGLPESLLPATSLVIRGMHELETAGVTPGTTEYADRLAAFVVEATESQDIPKTSYMLALIRQNYME